MEIIWGIVLVAFVIVVVGVIQAGAQRKQLEAKVSAFVAEIETEQKKMITSDGKATLTILDAPEFGYRPVGKELLVGVQENVERRELRSTGRYRSSGTSVSIPIMKGVRYRVGGGTVQTLKEWQTVGVGRLIVTDKAISFESSSGNSRTTWNQVADISVMWDGFQIHKRTGKPILFQISSHDPKFAAVVLLLFSRAD